MLFSEIAPPEAAHQESRLIWTGRKEAVIEGHRGLFSYETKCVRVRAGTGLWTVTGEGLTLGFYGADDVLIKGRIESVALSEAAQ